MISKSGMEENDRRFTPLALTTSRRARYASSNDVHDNVDGDHAVSRAVIADEDKKCAVAGVNVGGDTKHSRPNPPVAVSSSSSRSPPAGCGIGIFAYHLCVLSPQPTSIFGAGLARHVQAQVGHSQSYTRNDRLRLAAKVIRPGCLACAATLEYHDVGAFAHCDAAYSFREVVHADAERTQAKVRVPSPTDSHYTSAFEFEAGVSGRRKEHD